MTSRRRMLSCDPLVDSAVTFHEWPRRRPSRATPVMQTSMAAFRFALVGFSFPFIFVYRPQLLFHPVTGRVPAWADVIEPLVVAMLGVTAFDAGVAAYLFAPLSIPQRAVAFGAVGCC